MQPLVPIATINDLAHEYFSPKRHPECHARPHHPDGFLAGEEMLRPDPVFHALRAFASWGPFGAIRRWLDRQIEEQEARQPIVGLPLDFTRATPDRTDDDLAA
jgi:hypothetical protein